MTTNATIKCRWCDRTFPLWRKSGKSRSKQAHMDLIDHVEECHMEKVQRFLPGPYDSWIATESSDGKVVR